MSELHGEHEDVDQSRVKMGKECTNANVSHGLTRCLKTSGVMLQSGTCGR